MKNLTDQELLTLMQQGKDAALDQLFRNHYAYLCQVVYRMLKDEHQAEDLVQEVFLDFWRKRDTIQISHSIRAYLRRATTNKTLNFIRDQRLVVDDEEKMPLYVASKNVGAQESMEVNELKKYMHEGIDSLPERCRLVFTLSRFEELSNKEIAAHLEISVKTVENQMTKALKFLKEWMAPYINSIIFAMILFVN